LEVLRLDLNPRNKNNLFFPKNIKELYLSMEYGCNFECINLSHCDKLTCLHLFSAYGIKKIILPSSIKEITGNVSFKKISKNLNKLINLEKLKLHRCREANNIQINSLPLLRELYIGEHSIDYANVILKNLPQFEKLTLDGRCNTTSVIDGLNRLKEIEINLCDVKASKFILPAKGLQHLSLGNSYNDIIGFPCAIKQPYNLKTLKLCGILPDDFILSKLSNLEYLYLQKRSANYHSDAVKKDDNKRWPGLDLSKIGSLRRVGIKCDDDSWDSCDKHINIGPKVRYVDIEDYFFNASSKCKMFDANSADITVLNCNRYIPDSSVKYENLTVLIIKGVFTTSVLNLDNFPNLRILRLCNVHNLNINGGQKSKLEIIVAKGCKNIVVEKFSNFSELRQLYYSSFLSKEKLWMLDLRKNKKLRMSELFNEYDSRNILTWPVQEDNEYFKQYAVQTSDENDMEIG
jgi:hypothetical protein